MTMTRLLAGAALAALCATTTFAEPITRMGKPEAPIATSAKVPAGSDLVYISGTTPSPTAPTLPPNDPKSYGDTRAQTMSALTKIKAALADQGMTMADVVMMRVFLVGDPNMAGKMDFGGMMDAYKTFFGAADQPNKPARTTVQVAGLASPAIMVEIEVTAARAK